MGREVQIEAVKHFRVEICQLLPVWVENIQDAHAVTWHLLRSTGTQPWRSTGYRRNDWISVDSGNRSIYGVLKGLYPARLLSIMKVRELTTCLLDKLLLVDRLYVENSGKRVILQD